MFIVVVVYLGFLRLWSAFPLLVSSRDKSEEGDSSTAFNKLLFSGNAGKYHEIFSYSMEHYLTTLSGKQLSKYVQRATNVARTRRNLNENNPFPVTPLTTTASDSIFPRSVRNVPLVLHPSLCLSVFDSASLEFSRIQISALSSKNVSRTRLPSACNASIVTTDGPPTILFLRSG